MDLCFSLDRIYGDFNGDKKKTNREFVLWVFRNVMAIEVNDR